MKTLHVDVGEDISSKKNAVINFQDRDVVVEDCVCGKKAGRITRANYAHYTLCLSVNRFLAIFGRYEFIGTYHGLIGMEIINPREGDERRAREGYHEVTQTTINETTRWAGRVRT